MPAYYNENIQEGKEFVCMDTRQFRMFHWAQLKVNPHSSDLQLKWRSRNWVIYHFQQLCDAKMGSSGGLQVNLHWLPMCTSNGNGRWPCAEFLHTFPKPERTLKFFLFPQHYFFLQFNFNLTCLAIEYSDLKQTSGGNLDRTWEQVFPSFNVQEREEKRRKGENKPCAGFATQKSPRSNTDSTVGNYTSSASQCWAAAVPRNPLKFL